MKNKILITVLIILVLCLGGYLVYDKVIKDDDSVDTTGGNEDTESVAFDLTEAEKIIEPYLYVEYPYNTFDEINDESYQKQLAILNIDKSKFEKADCKATYGDKEEYTYDEDMKAYIGPDGLYCFDTVSISYEVLNESYKMLFGKDLEKKVLILIYLNMIINRIIRL